MEESTQELLDEWNDPLGCRDVPSAEDLISALQVEIAGKEALINALQNDIRYYRKDWRDQMKYDQGLEDETI